MKLTVFQSGKGDCLLLTGDDGRRMLVDGGTSDSYQKHAAKALGKLREDGEQLDVVYLSHIDDDHIAGILKLMNDEMDWRVHDFHLKQGNTKHKAPAAPRPPRIKAIWHNAFHEQVKDNTGEVEDMLAASASVLSGSENEVVKALASEQNDLSTSIEQSIKLARRVSPDQLGIKLNSPAKGKLMMVRPATSAAIKIGGMRIQIIGPFNADLKKLREEWNEWLKNNKERLKTIQAKARKDESKFTASEIADLMLPKLAQAEELSALLPLSATKPFELGDRKKVTTPNLASLMLYVEEKGKKLLLTGDGHHLDIIEGLKHIKKLKGGGGLHVDVLKVQHHGSEFNISEKFCRTITADNYVFCANGEHDNPDIRVIQAIADSRFGQDANLSNNKEVRNPFKFWINSTSNASSNAKAKAHMKKVEKLVSDLSAKSGGQMSFFFLKGSSFDLQI
ncbi:MAG: MBL fold metallo-hydrolase [Pyrinomonadaceae bacterium]